MRIYQLMFAWLLARFHRIHQGYAQLLELNNIQKSRTVSIILIFFHSFFFLILSSNYNNELLNSPALPLILLCLGSYIVVSILLFILSYYLKATIKTERYFPILCIGFYTGSLMSIGYFTGIMSIMTGIFSIGSIFLGLLLFDRKIMFWGTLPCLVVFYSSGLLTMLDIIPYAPVYKAYSLISQSMQSYSILLNLIMSTVVGVILLGLFNACLDRWTAREQQQQILMTQDSLTQILNRHGFNQQFKKIKNHSIAQQLPLCVALLDIDFFKKINDQYGHDCGDEVLKAIAQILRLNLRQQDFIARFGGEEFIIILSNTKTITAKKIIERCRTAIENHELLYNDQIIKFTASFGLCSSAQQGYQQQALLLAADQMLYQAKSFGRNCIQVAHHKPDYKTA